jgi:hypothetical protein
MVLPNFSKRLPERFLANVVLNLAKPEIPLAPRKSFFHFPNVCVSASAPDAQ